MLKELLIIMVLPALLCGESQKDVIKRAKEFAKSQRDKVESTFEYYDRELFITEEKFDSDSAWHAINSEAVPDTDVSKLAREGIKNVDLNNNLHPDEAIFQISDELANGNLYQEGDLEMSEEFVIKKCRQNGSPYRLSYTRTLDVQIKDETQATKICFGHYKEKKFHWESDAKKEEKKQKKKLSNDKSVKNFTVEVSDGGVFSRYKVKINWWHINDASVCDEFKSEGGKKGEEIDVWTQDDENKYQKSKTPDCTFTHSKCLDATESKNINGNEVFRKCWMEDVFFLCKHAEKDDCGFLQNQNCSQIEKKCVQNGYGGCAIWELTFKCGGKIRFKKTDNDGNSNEEELWEAEYEPNESFSDVYTKLKVLEEMQKEIKSHSTIENGNVHIFKGLDRKCAKSVSSDLMYDCCHSMNGLATDVKLAKCSSDELELAEMRAHGLCHYIGSYEEKFLDMWKSRDNHVFCCFSNKLSKVVQEGIRDQLGIEWGSAKNPVCRGLTINEITKADFSRLDLSEAFSEASKNAEGNKERLDAFTNRLKESLESEVEDAI